MNSYTYTSSGTAVLMKCSVIRLRNAFAVLAVLFCTVGLFQTKAEARLVTNVYTQGFENGIPDDWSYYGYWYWSSGGYGDNNGSAVFNFWENDNFESDGSLTTPTFDLSIYTGESDDLFIEFDMWFEYEYYNNDGDDYIDFVAFDNTTESSSPLASYSTSSDHTYYNPDDEGYQYNPFPDRGYWRHVRIPVPQELRTESVYFRFISTTEVAGGNFAVDNFTINAEQPLNISSTPSFLEFGSTSLGAFSAPQTITITNESSVFIDITSITKIGAQPDDFEFVGALPTFIAPNSSATVSVRFAPTFYGDKYAKIEILNISDNLPLISVDIHGKGVAPGVELIPIGSVNTPNRMFKKTRTILGDTLNQNFLVKNIGEGALVIFSSSFIDGENPGMYTITRIPAPIGEGMTDTMTVRFIPTQEGSVPARLNIENNGYNGRQVVDLFGIGVLPRIELTPGEMLTFDSVPMGITVCKSVRISNNGSDTLRLTNNYLSSSDGDFSYTPLTGENTKIAPNSFRDVQVCITPLQKGTRRARLRFTTNIPLTFEEGGNGGNDDNTYSGGQSPQGNYYEPEWIRNDTSAKSVEIWANAVPSDKTIIAMGDFSDVVIGTEASAAVTFTNIGSEVITVEEPFFEGSHADDFTVTKANFPLDVAPGTSINFTVVGTPKVRGENLAVMNIATKSEDRQYLQRMNVNVNGLIARSSVNETALSFDKLYLGEESSKTVTVVNTGDVDQVYTATLVGAGFALTSDAVTDAVAPGSSAVYTVKFAPSFKGAASGTLTLTSSHIAAMSVALSGDADEKPVTQSVTGEVSMKGFVLSQNTPNPAISNTSFSFTAPSTSEVRVILADVTGKTVRELANGVYGTGTHMVNFSFDGIASGSYLYILESDGVRLVRHMAINK